MSVLETKYIVNEQGMIVEEIEEGEVNESEGKVNPPCDNLKYETAENIEVNRSN